MLLERRQENAYKKRDMTQLHVEMIFWPKVIWGHLNSVEHI